MNKEQGYGPCKAWVPKEWKNLRIAHEKKGGSMGTCQDVSSERRGEKACIALE